MDKKVGDYWQAFCATLPGGGKPNLFEVFSFGDTPQMADELGTLVVAGIKTATCSLLWEYEATDEPLPNVGDYSVVLDGKGEPLCIIQTTELTITPFIDVDAPFASDEGEGDRTLAYWRDVHWRYFEPYCVELGRELREEMPLVCERFRVVKR